MTSQNKNFFLSGLSPSTRASLLSRSIDLKLSVHTVLYEEGCVPRYAYFLTCGLASVVTPMSNGASAEMDIIGREGVVGSLHLLGSALLPSRCMMQLSGRGLRIPYSELQKAYANSDEVRARILEFVQEQAATVGQIAGCNRLHSAEQRLTRWLLMAADRTHSDVLGFTQEYLAEMIATKRTTVTIIAGELQERGLVSYSRGNIHILNRSALEAAACDCYPIAKRLYLNLYKRDALPRRE
jgi:CRP-like cAMP-binding protein